MSSTDDGTNWRFDQEMFPTRRTHTNGLLCFGRFGPRWPVQVREVEHADLGDGALHVAVYVFAGADLAFNLDCAPFVRFAANSPRAPHTMQRCPRRFRLASGRPHGEMILRFFDTSPLQQNAEGTFGNFGKNVLRGPRHSNTDLGILKHTRVNERVNVQFRAEFFNIFNNVNFRLPNATLTSPAVGRITTAFDSRIIQFGLKAAF